MQLGGTRFKKLTDAEKARRRANNLCLYCGEPNHHARNCPHRAFPHTGSRPAHSVHVAISPVTPATSPANAGAGNDATQP
jgi:hypothetical protein